MNMGNKIRIRREALGLTLEAVGQALGVHRSTVMRYENADTRRIPRETVEKLAAVLKTTPADLMGWEENEAEELDPEIRLIARNMQKLPQDQRAILFKMIRTMSDIADEELRKHESP